MTDLVPRSVRTPKDFRNPTIRANRALTRDPTYVAAFVNVPIRVEDLAIELDETEIACLERAPARLWRRRRRRAALRDIFFTWWEERFLGAAEAGAPAIGDRRGDRAYGIGPISHQPTVGPTYVRSSTPSMVALCSNSCRSRSSSSSSSPS